MLRCAALQNCSVTVSISPSSFLSELDNFPRRELHSEPIPASRCFPALLHRPFTRRIRRCFAPCMCKLNPGYLRYAKKIKLVDLLKRFNWTSFHNTANRRRYSPSGETAVASMIIKPVPPIARLPR